jgi:predicted dehydrogenase
MVRIGIIGAGNGATLHADAVLRLREVTLSGLGVRPGGRHELATHAGVATTTVPDLCHISDALIVAVPPPEVAGVLEQVRSAVADGAPLRALLIEPPFGSIPNLKIPVMAGANLLHAPVVRTGLADIAAMGSPHHLQLIARGPRPAWLASFPSDNRSPLSDPGVRLASVLLAAAAEPALDATINVDGNGLRCTFTLTSGRQADLVVGWSDGSAIITLEAASPSRVVRLTLDPLPSLERDGIAASPPEIHPLEALGFVDQTRRLVRVCQGGEPWPEATSAQAIEALMMAAI